MAPESVPLISERSSSTPEPLNSESVLRLRGIVVSSNRTEAFASSGRTRLWWIHASDADNANW